MNNLYRLIITLLMFTLFFTGIVFSQDSTSLPKTGLPTYLDTLNIGKELIVSFPKKENTVENKSVEENNEDKKAVSNEPLKISRSVIPNGFRIQILASSSVDAIKEKKAELEEQILLPMYISFKSPYYKLLAGNFTDRESAEKALAGIKDQGLTDAWIVSSEVFKKE